MIKVCQQNKDSVLNQIYAGKLDAVALSASNLVDDIILAMSKNGILSCLKEAIPDKRASNASLPFELILALAVAAKMKIKTSLTDIPFAITDHRTLAELGYNIIDTDGVNKGIMTEGALRRLFVKYNHQELFSYYNKAVQDYIMPKLDMEPSIHILDCTKLEVNLDNENYEDSTIVTDPTNKAMRGYKLSTLRGIVDDTGIIEEIRFGSIKDHDLQLSEEMLKTSPMLKPGHILINDRGFLSRDLTNYLKTNRQVDTYIPLRKNMEAYKMAVSTAKFENKWIAHPNKKRGNQKIAFVSRLGSLWQSDNQEDDVEINACVVWDTKSDKPENEYAVFITTDLTKSAKEIIKTYELRWEIEEEYRQIKDFWEIEDFKSTKLNVIAFHIICVLFGYMFFRLYTMMPEGEKYSGKSLPIVLKNYVPKNRGYVVLYVGNAFGIFAFIEVIKLYASLDESVRIVLDPVLGEV